MPLDPAATPAAPAAPAEPDYSTWGTFTPDDPEAPVAEAAPAAPAKAEAPAAEAPAAPAKPEVPPDDEPEPEDDGFEDLTIDELNALIAESVKQGVAQALPRDGDDPDAVDDTPPEQKKLADANAALTAKLAEMETKHAEQEYATGLAALQHSIDSTIGKLKMTDAEVTATTEYLVKNPDLARGGMKFEEAAMRRFPGIGDRARVAPATPAAAAEGALGAPPAANGAGAPTAFKHNPKASGYEDVTNHLLKSGELARWGKYT